MEEVECYEKDSSSPIVNLKSQRAHFLVISNNYKQCKMVNVPICAYYRRIRSLAQGIYAQGRKNFFKDGIIQSVIQKQELVLRVVLAQLHKR